MPDREPRNPGAVWCASFVRESFGDLVIHLPIVISAMAWKFALVHLPGAVIGVAKSTIAAGSCGSLAVGTSGGPAAGSLACGGQGSRRRSGFAPASWNNRSRLICGCSKRKNVGGNAGCFVGHRGCVGDRRLCASEKCFHF